MKTLEQITVWVLLSLFVQNSTAQNDNPFVPVPTMESVDSFKEIINNIDWGDHDINIDAQAVPCRSELWAFMETRLSKVRFHWTTYLRVLFEVRMLYMVIERAVANDFANVETGDYSNSVNPKRAKMLDALRESTSLQEFTRKFNSPDIDGNPAPQLSNVDLVYLEEIHGFYSRLVSREFMFHRIEISPDVGEQCTYFLEFYSTPKRITETRIEWQIKVVVDVVCLCERPDNTRNNIESGRVHFLSMLTSTMTDHQIQDLQFTAASRPKMNVDRLDCCRD